ncbi:MAG: UpxY family transcription antiterminator [Phaeodactylibacter sp.]|nr:UpxY family transcription antiterminator [Phaeodactylibacter sp.]MCB9292732.1 UpxY family transcription antiterminator [Lewinellaceae bacterium]
MMNPKNQYSNQLDQREARWFAVYTKYKREKLILQRLREKDIHAYLPIQKLVRRYKRKVREVELPLISCYIFTKITTKDYVPVLETEDVVSFVKFSRNLIAIPEAEMQLMQRIVDGGSEIEADPSAYEVGDAVEIIGGNLTGIKGILVEQQNKKNFLVELDNIGYTLRMYVNPALLRKTGKRLRGIQ